MATVSLTLTASVANLTLALDAFCTAYGWDSASGVTQQDFVRAKVREFILLPYQKQIRAAKAQQAAIDADALATALAMTVT